jgi:uncharacterized caspase-like protein
MFRAGRLLAAFALASCLPVFGLDRLAIVVGDNTGLSDEKPLSYATRDAEQVFAALAQLGGVDQGSGTLLLDVGPDQVRLALKSMRERIRALKAQGRKSQLLVYYSGHGSDEALHLEGERLPLSEVRGYFAGMEADFKLLIADACFSGSLLQGKGAGLADPVPIRYQDELSVNGSAILTSSSAGELSQESKELRGSLFTHYFVTALRGAADFDRDGKITLWEVYAYTQASLRRRMGGGRAGAQTPGFDVQARGSDNVVLTRMDLGQAFLALKGLPPDDYRVLDAAGGSQLAELRISDPEGIRIALPRAAYLVFRGSGKVSERAYADLRRGRETVLGPAEFRPAGIDRLGAKGSYRAAPDAGFPGPATALGLAFQPRWYPDFPGRGRHASALQAGFSAARDDWDLGVAALFLPVGASVSRGNRLTQGGAGVSGEVRYYWSYSRAGAAFLGPRGEWWSLAQTINGKAFPRADLLGAFAVTGLGIGRGAGLGATLSAGGGWFFNRDVDGDIRRQPAYTLGFSLEYGP